MYSRERNCVWNSMLVHRSERDWKVAALGKGVLTLTRPVEYGDVVGGKLVFTAHSD